MQCSATVSSDFKNKSIESILLAIMVPYIITTATRYYLTLANNMNSPMQNCILPIENKFPFYKSIETTKVYGALLLRRHFYNKFMESNYYGDIFLCLANEMQQSQWEAALFQSNIRILNLTNQSKRSNRQKFMGPYHYGDIFLCLANEMQQPNGKLDFSDRIRSHNQGRRP